MRPLAHPAPPTPIDRMGLLMGWIGVLAGFGISLSFAAMAFLGAASHDPPSRTGLAIFLSLGAGFATCVRGIVLARRNDPPAPLPGKMWEL